MFASSQQPIKEIKIKVYIWKKSILSLRRNRCRIYESCVFSICDLLRGEKEVTKLYTILFQLYMKCYALKFSYHQIFYFEIVLILLFLLFWR